MEENDQFLEISLLSRSWSWQVSPSYSVCDGATTLSNITGKFRVKGKKSHCQMFRCQLLNNDFLSLLWGCLKFVVSFRLLLHELLHVWVYVQVAAFWWVDPHSQNLHSKFWKVFFFPVMNQRATGLPRRCVWRARLMNERRGFKVACPRFTNRVLSK
jgi:hypothetical protein